MNISMLSDNRVKLIRISFSWSCVCLIHLFILFNFIPSFVQSASVKVSFKSIFTCFKLFFSNFLFFYYKQREAIVIPEPINSIYDDPNMPQDYDNDYKEIESVFQLASKSVNDESKRIEDNVKLKGGFIDTILHLIPLHYLIPIIILVFGGVSFFLSMFN